MKKLGLSLVAAAAFLISTNNVQAQVTETEEMEEIVEVEQEQNDDYQEIEIMALPQAVKVAVIKDFEGATTEEAWVRADAEGKKTYKITIDIDGESKEVLADADGNWIEEE